MSVAIAKKIRNITIDQGANVVIDINVANTGGSAVDLTLYTANVGYRRHHESANAGYMGTTLNANGLMVIALPSANATAAASGRYVYDVKITRTSDSTSFIIQDGILTILASTV